MNTVMLMGRLTRDPESRATQSGTAVVRFSLAVNRPKRKDKNQDADFINCVAFGRTAEVIQQYVFKGNRLLLEGEWNDKFLDELEGFPLAQHDDQVDAADDAFNAVAKANDWKALIS